RATYEAHGVLRQGERNVVVRPGTRIAGLPRHTLKLGADWRVADGWSVGGDLQAVSGRGIAGNEDGVVEDEGDERVDVGLPGYAVVNVRASWRPRGGGDAAGWEVFARVGNLFDRRYETFGALAETVFDPTGTSTVPARDAVFVAPGAPRSVFVGVRWRH
ncbi:MAG TPA: TonB-dependent receptor, partial [Gemmatimonadales bacterium]|nr:TonB-dependent receptor [Gemmatimonadales bacterium]